MGEWRGAADAVALHEVNANGREVIQDAVVLHAFGDGLFAKNMRDLVHRAHHGEVEIVVGDVFDVGAVEQQKNKKQKPQKKKQTKAGAKVVEREAAAEAAELIDHALRLVDVGDARSLGNFENNPTGVDILLVQLRLDEGGHIGIGEGTA